MHTTEGESETETEQSYEQHKSLMAIYYVYPNNMFVVRSFARSLARSTRYRFIIP